MVVPIELAKKAARYEKLLNEANTLFEELEEWANENGYEDFYVDGFGTAQLAEGEEQLDGEYCDQTMRGEDCGDGTYYYPIHGSTMYMWVKYSFSDLAIIQRERNKMSDKEKSKLMNILKANFDEYNWEDDDSGDIE